MLLVIGDNTEAPEFVRGFARELLLLFKVPLVEGGLDDL